MRLQSAFRVAGLLLIAALGLVLVATLFLSAHYAEPPPTVRRHNPVSEMTVGQTAYVEASALRFDANGHGWLNGSADTQIWSGLQADIRIERLAGGYRVYVYDDELYPVDDKGFMPGYVPVTELEYDGKTLSRLPKELSERVTDQQGHDVTTYAAQFVPRVVGLSQSLV